MLTERLLEPLRERPEASALLLDVDGTLAPIVGRPDDARVPDSTREALAGLARRYALVACVSGRSALDARAVVGLESLAYAGNHGYELLARGAAEPEVDSAVAERAGAAAEFVEASRARVDAAGLRLEDKGPIQALHGRAAPDEERAEAGARELAAEAEGAGLVPHWGRKVLELRPTDAVDKGSAVRRLLAPHGTLAAALYAGDDTTDLDAFRGLDGLEVALRVAVASPEGPAELREAADLVVDSPAGLLSLLRSL